MLALTQLRADLACQAEVPCRPRQGAKAGSRGRSRTYTVPGLSRMPLPIGLRGLVVPRVGLAPTSSGLQPDAWTRSATEANGGRGGSRTHMLLLARQVPSRLGHTPELVHEVGLEPTSPGSEPGLLPDYITRDQWRKRQDSNLRNRRGRSPGLATRRDQPLRPASDWRKRRDSNPRSLSALRFSRPALSATQPLFPMARMTGVEPARAR